MPLSPSNRPRRVVTSQNAPGTENIRPLQFRQSFTPDAPPTKRQRLTETQWTNSTPVNHTPTPTPSAPGRHKRKVPSSETPSRSSTSRNSVDDRQLPLEYRLKLVLEEMTTLGLPLAEFIYQVFRLPGTEERSRFTAKERTCYQTRTSTISKFLRGECRRTPADLLDLWLHHAHGAADRHSDEMFSSEKEIPFADIDPVRPAMTSLAVQVVMRELVAQARSATMPGGGLHVFIPTKKNPHPHKVDIQLVDWRDLGQHTHAKIAELHQKHQPLLWQLLTAVANPDTYQKNNSVRRNRPVDAVVATAISKLAFSRTPHARLGPTLESLFNFASRVPFDKFRYDSRVGNTLSYSTTVRALYGLSRSADALTLDHARDPGRWFFIVVNNVQHYVMRRSLRIGRENFMNIGMAGTLWMPPVGVADPSVFDYDQKQKLRAQSRREEITTGQLLSFLEPEHEQKVFAFQWLWLIGYYVPQLQHLQKLANQLLRTEGCRQKLPNEPTACFPIPSNNGRETEQTEMLDSMLDFFASSGQTAEDFLKRQFPLLGDGFTFDMFLRLMQHRQFHESPFHSLRIWNPGLAWWHTFWTNDTRIVDRHLIDYASRDASTLGCSASKIGRKIPKDQGKYNYNQANELLYFVLDMRMLDCWRLRLLSVAQDAQLDTSQHKDVFNIINILDKSGRLPSTEMFREYASELHDLYTTEKAVYSAHSGKEKSNMPRGSPARTTTVLSELDAVDLSQEKLFLGDASLARSKDFMRDVMRSREMVWSAAEGDVGRVWAQMKTIMFSFAGSSHKKYAQYLLEVIIDLHIESTPELRAAMLSTGVATLSGVKGSFKCVDLLQEYFQRILEAIVQYKGQDFGDRFIRDGISRNLGHFQRLKDEMLGGVGLTRRSQKRSHPSTHREMAILLEDYRIEEVHSFIPRREHTPLKPSKHPTQFAAGVRTFGPGGLLTKSTRRSALMRDTSTTNSASPGSLFTATELSMDADDDEDETDRAPLYSLDILDGEISHQQMEPNAAARAIIAMYEEYDGNADGNTYSDDDEMDFDD